MKHTIKPAKSAFKKTIKIPGDKSVSHRSIIFGSIANGITEASNFLNSDDCLCTKKAFEAMGVKIEISEDKVIIHGKGIKALKKPKKDIDLGNSGTAIRLLSGLFAGLPFETTLKGDASLSKRPMKRIIEPLQEMGALIEATDNNFAPIIINKGMDSAETEPELHGIRHISSVASAQVKSCLLLAGLNAEGVTTIAEPHLSRNHTELMLKSFGAHLKTAHIDDPCGSDKIFPTVSITRLEHELKGQKFTIPGDISSAAFFMVAGAIIPGSEITIKDVGLNPTRTGVIDIFKAMGANLKITNERLEGGEPLGDMIIKYSELKATEISGDIIPRLIDDIPVLAIMAAQAKGTTIIKDAEELRVKESDRVKTTVNMLKALGVNIEEKEDGMIIEGRGGKAFEHQNTVIDSHGDHRIAMASAIAALQSNNPIEILETEFVATSFPSFFELIA